MIESELNQNIKLAPHDGLMAKTVLCLFPSSVRPNHITLARFLTSPLVFWFLWQDSYKIGLLAFVLVAFTDAIDGSMARMRKQITIWGIKYDGIADKFLIIGVVILLVLKSFGLLFAGIIIGIEIITAIVAAFYAHKGVVHQANIWGKTKMFTQVLAISALLIDIIWGLQVFIFISQWLFVLSIFLSFVSAAVHTKHLHVT